ncbi:serine/threonine-protein kinase [Xylaria telfairii]|nr:serine/threonine-protein kinase [Xylaria telfairii]
MATHTNDESGTTPVHSDDSQLQEQARPNQIPIYAPSAPPSGFAQSVHVADSAIYPAPSQPTLNIGMFDIAKPLGSGSFGKVYLAKHRESGFICALKILDKERIKGAGNEKHVRREIEVHSQLRHPGILGFYGWFHDSNSVVIILEYAIGGELFDALLLQKWFSERRAAKYVAQVAFALLYLQKKYIMHRDIKPENILVGLHGELKLADFGYAVRSFSNSRKTKCGTLEYMAPEMVTPSHRHYTNAIDLWALGVLTYEFLVGKPPFVGETDAIACTRIRNLDSDPLPESISSEAKDFINSLLVLDPAKRLPLERVIDHPWIVNNCT